MRPPLTEVIPALQSGCAHRRALYWISYRKIRNCVTCVPHNVTRTTASNREQCSFGHHTTWAWSIVDLLITEILLPCNGCVKCNIAPSQLTHLWCMPLALPTANVNLSKRLCAANLGTCRVLRYGIVLLAVSRRTISSQLAASKAELMEVLPLMNFQADLVLGTSKRISFLDHR